MESIVCFQARVNALVTLLTTTGRTAGHEVNFGNMFQAPYAVGDDSGTRVASGGNATIRIKVLKRNGAGFDVDVTYTRP